MRIVKRILKIFAFAATGLLVLIVLFALATQTSFFKDRLRQILNSSLSANLNGRVHLGKLDGNFLNGFTIDSVAVDDGGDPFFNASRITCSYSLLPLLENKLELRYLIIEQPVFHITRDAAGAWNFQRLIKASQDTSTGKFDWFLSLENIELKHGNVSLTDSFSLKNVNHWNLPPEYVEYHSLSLNDINLQFSATIKDKDIRAQVKHVGFYSPQSSFQLTHAKFDVSASSQGITLRNALIQTGRSYIELDASMSDVDLFQGLALEKFQHDSTHLTLRTKNLDLAELRSFIPQVEFLDGSVFLDLDASGEFGNLLINHCNLRAYESSLNLSGNVRNLHQPHQLALNILAGDSRINPADIARILPGIHLPAFKKANPVNLFVQFLGTPRRFTAKTIIKGQKSGELTLNTEMNFEHNVPRYSGTFSSIRFDAASFLEHAPFQSALTTRGTLSGEGFGIETMRGSLKIAVDSSRYQNITIYPSEISLDAAPRYLQGVVNLRGPDMGAILHGQLDMANTKQPRFAGDFSLKSFDVGRFLNDTRYQSNLTVQGKFQGSGSNIDDVNGDVTLGIEPSKYVGHTIPHENVHLTLDQSNIEQKRFSMQSSIADAEFDGRFDLDLSTSILVQQLGLLVEAVKRHATPADSSLPPIPAASKLLVNEHSTAQRSMNFTYAVNVKDLSPLFAFFGGTPFDARANLSGSIAGTEDFVSMSCKGKIDEFYFGSAKGGVLLNDATINLTLDSLNDRTPLEELNAKLDFISRSGSLGAKQFANSHLSASYNHLNGKVGFTGTLDSLYRTRFQANVSVQPSTYVFDLDSLLLSTNGVSWHNEQDVQLRLNLEGLRVLHAVMRRDDASVALQGALSPAHGFDLTASIQNFDLSELGVWLQKPELSRPGQGMIGKINAEARVTGSGNAPRIVLSATGEQMGYGQTPIGHIEVSLNYDSLLADLAIAVKHSAKDTLPLLMIKGHLPVNLAFSGVTDRFPDRPQQIQIVSERFNPGILGPFLPDMKNLSGAMQANVSLTGTPRHPLYAGSISLRAVRFLFLPNNISYILDGDLVPTYDSIDFKSLVVRNVPEKRLTEQGEATVTGSIAMRNFQITAFNLLVNGSMLLMTDATRQRISTMYGPLLTEIDPGGLKITGSLDQPHLSGKLYLREANLVFPPARTSAAPNSNLTLRNIVVDDTTKTLPAQQPRSKFFVETGEDSLIGNSDHAPEQSSPLVDRLRYNLTIETRGQVAIKMIFTPATGEELYAVLDGKVSAVNERGSPNIYGEIEIGQQSYYNFFKRFAASGKLKFVGQWDNPELDVQATYQGTRQDPQHPDTLQNVNVELNITGTRYEPKLQIAMKVQETPQGEYIDWSTRAEGGDIQSDAISFIITGKFRSDLTSRDQQDITTKFGSSTGATVASGLLSGLLTDMLQREFPWIRRADVSYTGGSTKVNVDVTAGTGRLLIGTNLNDIGYSNLSYQVSLGDALKSPSLRNLYLELQRKVQGETPEERVLTNEARLYYRFSF